MRTIICIVGLCLLALGLRWMQLFVCTDYRAHFRPVIIPMALAAIASGGWMLTKSMRRKQEPGRGGL